MLREWLYIASSQDALGNTSPSDLRQFLGPRGAKSLPSRNILVLVGFSAVCGFILNHLILTAGTTMTQWWTTREAEEGLKCNDTPMDGVPHCWWLDIGILQLFKNPLIENDLRWEQQELAMVETSLAPHTGLKRSPIWKSVTNEFSASRRRPSSWPSWTAKGRAPRCTRTKPIFPKIHKTFIQF